MNISLPQDSEALVHNYNMGDGWGTVVPRVNMSDEDWRFYLDVEPPVGPAAATSLAEALPRENSNNEHPWVVDRVVVGHEDKDKTIFSVQFSNREGDTEGAPPRLDSNKFSEFLISSASTLIKLSGTVKYIHDPVEARFDPIGFKAYQDKLNAEKNHREWVEQAQANKRASRPPAPTPAPKPEYFDPRGY